MSKLNEKNNDNKITPCIDTVDTKDKVYVYMDIPGVLNSSVDINFFENKVCIGGDKIKPYEIHALKKEILYGNFFRCVTLPITTTEIKKNDVDVKYNNGILAITINKTPENNTKEVKKKRNIFDVINEFYIRNIR